MLPGSQFHRNGSASFLTLKCEHRTDHDDHIDHLDHRSDLSVYCAVPYHGVSMSASSTRRDLICPTSAILSASPSQNETADKGFQEQAVVIPFRR